MRPTESELIWRQILRLFAGGRSNEVGSLSRRRNTIACGFGCLRASLAGCCPGNFVFCYFRRLIRLPSVSAICEPCISKRTSADEDVDSLPSERRTLLGECSPRTFRVNFTANLRGCSAPKACLWPVARTRLYDSIISFHSSFLSEWIRPNTVTPNE